jgi:hypothetical protein
MTLETNDSMGVGSLSQAPQWGHAGSAVQRAPGLVLRSAARLELVSADATQLQFAGRQAPLAPVLLCPLLLTLGSLPWLAPRPLDAVRVLTSGVFVAAACGLAAWAGPRRRRLQVRSRAGSREAASPGEFVAQPGKVRWVLDTEHAPNMLSASYRVTLEPDDGGSLTVLQSTDPERLLWQFSQVLRHWPGPVDCRWGLPAGARPWSIEPVSGPRARSPSSDRAVVVVPLAHRPLIWCARIMTVLVLTDLMFLVSSAGAGLAYIHPLSIVLPLLLGSCLVALAVGLSTGGWRLGVGAAVRREISVLGLRRERGSIRRESVRGVYALGVAAAEQWHVLVESADGPLALPVPRRDAEAIARQTERALVSARTS